MQTGKRTAEKRWTKSTILAQIFCVIMLVIWLYPLIKIIQISFRSGGIENYKRVLFIDGCPRRKVFTKMMLPLTKPAIATALIFAFMSSWNDYLLPLVMINRADEMTLTLLPQKFTAFAGVSNVGTIFASLVLLCVPIFIIYLFAQKYMVAGMAAGTIK